MDIAPAILRLRPEPDASQRQVIGHNKGPMLVIAGPGSGKTRQHPAQGGQPAADWPDQTR